MDKREAIMARLHAIAGEVLGNPARAYRNNLHTPEGTEAAIIILEGDEEVTDDAERRGRPGDAPRIVTALPHIFLLVGSKPEDVGTDLNALRARVIQAILQDVTLASLTHQGMINYRGMGTGLAAGRTMRGEANLIFATPYAMRVRELV